MAREIQQTFLPDSMPELTGWEIDARWITAREVGGDFYDIIPQDDNRLGLVIADVADKGMPAALYMTVTRTLIRAVTHGRTSPADVLQRVNNLLAMDAQNGMFITVFYAILDLKSGTLIFANAGHNKPIFVKNNSGQTEMLPKGGIALAVLEDIELQDYTLHLEEGDSLLCYTDGVTEAFSPDEEMFGENHLETLLASLQGQTIHDTLNAVVKAVTDFRGEREISDDVTLLGVRRKASDIAS